MIPFEYRRVTELDAAVQAAANGGSTKFLAGGTNLIDLMKSDVVHPDTVIDITRLPLTNIEALPDGGLRLGALARNTDTADHPLVREKYPLLSQALLAGATPQLRNMATNGGNLMQRTRCYYFMDAAFPQCNKRVPGSGCGALNGFNRLHAILGASDQCIATHPSDMCVALAALDATIQVQSRTGRRTIPITEFHRLPGNAPDRDANLGADELIVAIDLPPSLYASHAYYLKLRDRASYAFALVSVAAALDLDGDRVRSARVALGGVAHKPWRAEAAERWLQGKRLSQEKFQSAAETALRDARAYRYNAFKIEMAKHAVARALAMAGGLV